MDRTQIPNSSEVEDHDRRCEVAHNILVDCHQRGVIPTTQRIYDTYNDHDCDLIAQSVLLKAMVSPLIWLKAAVNFDDRLNELMGR